jgi:hypothetical protein
MTQDSMRSGRRELAVFEPSTKCCTYVPEVFNFLVGNVLLDESAAAQFGRKTIEERLTAGMAVTPLSLGIPGAYRIIYDSSPNLFGRAPSMRCPHYLDEDGGKCGIWLNRNSVCSTWFCRHVRGDTGRAFWADLKGLLSVIELDLAFWCCAELGLEPDALRETLAVHGKRKDELVPELVDRARKSWLREVWGHWAGREREFYESCSRLVAPLSWSDVCAIGGSLMRARRTVVADAYERLVSQALPERLQSVAFTRRPSNDGTAEIAAYSPHDRLLVVDDLLAILHRFDGRQTNEVLAEVENADGVTLDPQLVLRLVDFRVLKSV